ncbi:MAG TPA: cytochrome c oxidase subunit 3 [Steroidobacteraceae bacterium]|jgi:heme/copper-type cytochrome/quinol oxidase subunit 3
MSEVVLSRPENLPVGPTGRHGVGWWGVGTLVVSEAALFAYLLFAYFYTGATAPPGWLLDPAPSLKLALPNMVLLLISSVGVWGAERGIIKGRRGQALAGLGVAFALGLVFMTVQCLEWRSKPYRLGDSSYASLYFVTTGLHIAHVIVGLVVLAALFWWTALRYFSAGRRIALAAGALYWHFVNLISVCIFVTYYVTPHLGFGR